MRFISVNIKPNFALISNVLEFNKNSLIEKERSLGFAFFDVQQKKHRLLKIVLIVKYSDIKVVLKVFREMEKGLCKAPYLSHRLPHSVSALAFVPYEDVLGVGHDGGFSSLLIPGSSSNVLCK